MKVVTRAIRTREANSASEITPCLEREVEDDQLGQPARVHQGPDHAAGSDVMPTTRAAMNAPASLPMIATAISTSG